jgi:hypothetical protein
MPPAAPPKPVAAAKPAKISAVLKELFAAESIATKAHLDAWCGGASRDRLYSYVKERAPEHWDRVADPKAATRGAYQPLLDGTSASDAASMSDEDELVRMSDRATAEAHVGRVCTYDTAEGREYGRILRATASEIVLDRLSTAGGGVFVPHPVPVCPRSRNRVTYSRDVRLVEEAKAEAKASPAASVGGAGSPPATPAKTSPSAEALALKLAEELAEVHKREIARLTAVEAEYLALKAKLEAARVKRNEAVRAYKARAKKPTAAAGGGAAEPKSKDILDVFDFFPELVEELSSEDPGH